MDKLNLDGIHLDMQELLDKYNGKMHSCSDSTEIQQISLFCQQNRNDYRKPVLLDMINPMFAYAGLYPHTQKIYNITPDDLKESIKAVEVADMILSINRSEPTEGCETKIKLMKNSFKPDRDV